jgi:hypothetical protein
MMEFLEGLPTSRMKMEILNKFVTRDEEGNIEKSFEWPLLVFSKPSLFYPEELHELGKPIVWLEGLIHGNESAAGDAMLVLAQKFANGEYDDVLEKVSVVLVPRYNVDGAYKYQRGTDTANPFKDNMDQNRDNTSFESPITRLIHATFNKYAPDMSLDLHEMGTSYSSERKPSEEDPDKTIGLGTKYWHLLDLMVLNAAPINVPRAVQELSKNVFEANVYSDLAKQNMYSYWYWYGQTREYVEANVYDYETGQVIPGQRSNYLEVREGNPDEGITDPSFALQGTVSLLFETPKPGVTINYLKRVHAHVVGTESLLRTAVEHADELKQTVAEGRKELIELGKNVSEDDEIVLWTAGHVVPAEYGVLKFNDDHSDVEIGKEKFIAHRTDLEMIPLLTTVRPRAYIIAGDPEEMSAVVERLSHTGVQIERLNSSVPIEVEAQTIDLIRDPRDYSFHPHGSASSGLSQTVRLTTTEEKTLIFPKDTFVVHMDQVGGTHAALALEPLGNRSYANYWLSNTENEVGKQAGPFGGRIGFIPAAEGEEFQVYRYMGKERLDTNPVTIDRPWVSDTHVEQMYPLTKAEEEELAQSIIGNKNYSVDYINKFRVLTDTKAFKMILPLSYADKSLENNDWYLYDWNSNKFDSISGKENKITVTEKYISKDFKVIVAAGK